MNNYNKKESDNDFEIIESPDLNDIISGIDELAKDKNIPLIDRKNLVFTVKRKQLDKLKTKCNDEFEVKYKFQLL